jgi:hypothetical protein
VLRRSTANSLVEMRRIRTTKVVSSIPARY